jgi:hypothetical protein
MLAPSVFMPGALWRAGAFGFSTGSVGPVPDAMVAAKAAEDNRVTRARAVNLDMIMVSSPFNRVLT